MKEDAKVIKGYTGTVFIDWKNHSLWFLSIACFILSRLYWLIPLPGSSFLPAYRTYPGTFLTHFFISLGCGFASRSLPIALLEKPFEEGVHPESVIEYGKTGGYAAMWSGIRHRSGLRYFLTASLVTAAILLGNALEGELQSSVKIHYKKSPYTTPMDALECRHTTSSDYQAASDAYAQGLITHTLSDVANFIFTQHPQVFSLAILETQLKQIQNLSLKDSTTLKKRHHTQRTEDKGKTEASFTESTSNEVSASTSYISSSETFAPYNVNTSSSTATTSFNSNTVSSTNPEPTNNALQRDAVYLYIDGHPINLNKTSSDFYDFNSSQVAVTRNANGSYSAAPSNSSATRLNVFHHTTPDNQEALIIYSSTILEGLYVSSTCTNYTCELNSCYPATTTQASNAAVADALVQSLQSNIGLYGTSVLNILNHEPVHPKLVDALYMNPQCAQALTYPSQAHLVLPYSASHWTPLSLLWICLYVVLYSIGAYLIGYTEGAWSQLVRTRHMIPQIIHNSGNLFEDTSSGKAADQITYLDQKTGVMGFVRVYHQNYTIDVMDMPQTIEIEVESPQ